MRTDTEVARQTERITIASSVCVPALFNEHALAIRDTDYRSGARVEFQEIIFNAVAENHPVLRHLRVQQEGRLIGDSAKHQRGAGRLGWEGFPPRVEKVVRVPCKFTLDVRTRFCSRTWI